MERRMRRRLGNAVSDCAVSYCLGVLCSIVVGCGSPMVESAPVESGAAEATPGRALSIGSPAATGDEVPVELRNVPHVAVESVVDLPRRDVETYYHEVSRGERLADVARRYGLSAERLRQANGLDQSTHLQPGQLLAIPR